MVFRIATAIVLVFGSAHADIIYVDQSAAGEETGKSWTDAFNDLTTALASASARDEIWVARGEYKPHGDSRNSSFQLQARVALYGGFLGTETERSQRNWDLNRTVLSGDIGEIGVPEDNTFRVLTAEFIEDEALVDGFRITQSYNNCGCPNNQGGGLYAIRSMVAIANCEFVGNYAGGGGGIWNEDARLTVSGSVFVDNEVGAILNIGGEVRISQCLFDSNTGVNGGALGSFESGVYHVEDSQFVDNFGRTAGAYFGRGHVIFKNCVMFENKSNSYGGAARIWSGSAVFKNCAIGYNGAKFGEAGISSARDGNVIQIVNSILWGNKGGSRGTESKQLEGRGIFDVSHTCLQGWSGRFGGEGNHGLDPDFIDHKRGDFRIPADSPCVDAGDNAAVESPHDLDGNPRIINDTVDMGAYESVCTEVDRFKLACPAPGTLEARLRTRLPKGSTVILSSRRDDPRVVTVNKKGRASARWPAPPPQTKICPSGCDDTCRKSKCE